MAARVFVQRRKIVGLRSLAFAFTSLLGTLVAVGAPIAATAGVIVLGRALGLPLGAITIAGLVICCASFFAVTHLVGRGLEESARLRAPWGRIAVGAEGIRWDGWVRRHLTPWRDVHGTMSEGEAMVVVTREGARIVLATDEASALGEAVRAAQAAHASALRTDVPVALGSDRDVARWIARARTLLARDSYREGGVPPPLLARVLEDPDAPAAARAAAATALLAGDRTQIDRVRAVRDESVDEELATVLDDALEERFVPARWARLARRG